MPNRLDWTTRVKRMSRGGSGGRTGWHPMGSCERYTDDTRNRLSHRATVARSPARELSPPKSINEEKANDYHTETPPLILSPSRRFTLPPPVARHCNAVDRPMKRVGRPSPHFRG